MKILVIDDNANHLIAAKKTLSEHEIVTCQSYDEALDLLEAEYVDEEGKSWSFPKKGAKQLPYWDVVLCDLMMPAGRDAQGPKGMKFVGEEMPVGWSLAIIAAKCDAKYVMVVSDQNHHDHPASALLDRLFVTHIENAAVLFENNVTLIDLENGNKGKNWGMMLDNFINYLERQK